MIINTEINQLARGNIYQQSINHYRNLSDVATSLHYINLIINFINAFIFKQNKTINSYVFMWALKKCDGHFMTWYAQ